MNLDQHPAAAIIRPAGTVLHVENATITLDESHAPYGRATITAKAPADRDTLDLRNDWLRLELRLAQHFGQTFSLAAVTDIAGGGKIADLTTVVGGALGAISNRLGRPWNGVSLPSTRRALNLLIIGRRFDDAAGTVEITAATGEAQLLGDVLLAEAPVTAPGTALRTVCGWILARYGALLEPGTADAVVTNTPALVWKPGVAAWDYLNPMLEAASLRLWCDDAGAWWLTERQSQTPGSVQLSADATITDLSDQMRLDDPETWADAVVVEYLWTDDDGVRQTAVDVAGAQPARSAYTTRRDAVYPGPGAAAGILNRRRGRGRVMEVEARASYRPAPGQTINIVVPDLDLQVGYVSQVVWRLPEARMTIRTRALISVPATAWDFLPAGEQWNDSPVGQSWVSESV